MDAQRDGSQAIDGVERELGKDAWVQRAAWILLTALLAAIALGLFGRGGPLSDMRATAPDRSLAIDYQRFIRYHSPDELTASLRADGPRASVLLDAEYAQTIGIEQVAPEPARVVSEGGVLRFEFHATPGMPLRATFSFSSRHYGPVEGWIAADGGRGAGPRVPIRHFTYP